ncbi:slr1658 superfamily regulator [Nodosilinea sp. PGN35]|uniref:slr1658 superfamily regulator n=1 Tax=Nodosilinea sp. PGN35 TaxID=3020489 RepID=UPI0023B2F2A6|nr:ATP-binding protein [Nodosilinea sp. TSF1-S3]MDF0369608.1 ATP-binding protein [Nodosilinea sp. TSF1-S3]
MIAAPTPNRFGRFVNCLENSKEYLTICFSPSASARQQRWRNYGLSADFLGDYFATFFPGNPVKAGAPEDLMQRDTVKSAISYIANELLENAIKYHTDRAPDPISISLFLYEDFIVFQSVNLVEPASAEQFKGFIQDVLTASDIDTVFSQQLEKTALGQGSHMGFLTMMCDYGVEFGWGFEPPPQHQELIQVNVQAYLSLKATF